MLTTLEIVAMTTELKTELLAKAAKQMIKGRYEATIALAALERSGAWLDAQCKSMHEFAAKKTRLEPEDVSKMLWIGRRLLDVPELAETYRAGRITWSHVRALVPHITSKNAAEWLPKAIRMTTNALEREIGRHRAPSVGGPTRAVHLPIPAWRRFEHLAKCIRLESGEKNLTDAECFLRLLDEVEAAREAARTPPTAAGTSSAPPAPPPTSGRADEAVVPLEPGASQSRHIPADIRRKVMNRARHACEVKSCRNRFGLEVHHVKVPFCKGGPHSLANLIVACSRCHLNMHRVDRHGARTPGDACEHATSAAAAGSEESDLAGREERVSPDGMERERS